MTKIRNDDESAGILFAKAMITGSASSSFYFVKFCLGFFPSFVTLSDETIAWINSSLDQLQPYAQSLTLCWLIMSWFYLMRNPNNGDSSSGDEKKSDSVSDGNERKRRKTRSRKFLLLSSATIVCLSLMFMPEGLRTMNTFQASSSADEISSIIKLDYKVDNMDCGGCVRAVEATLSKQSGVVSAKVLSLELGEVEVYLNKDLVENYERKEFDKILSDALMLKGYELHGR